MQANQNPTQTSFLAPHLQPPSNQPPNSLSSFPGSNNSFDSLFTIKKKQVIPLAPHLQAPKVKIEEEYASQENLSQI